jgi:hypothetical protein
MNAECVKKGELEMKKVVGSFVVVWALLSGSGQAASVTTKGGWDNDRMQLGDPTVFNRTLEACSHMGVRPEVQQKLAELMKVPQTKVRYEFCRRMLTGYAKGAITYDDYVAFVRDYVASDSIAHALGVSRSTLESLRIQRQNEVARPVVMQMSSGEIFRGSTIDTSRTGAHFLLRSTHGSAKCSGDDDSAGRWSTATFSITCSDGRTGTATITIASDHMSAAGRVTLSDGSKGQVSVGRPQKS